jgi:small subunit ribosomal protein S6
MSKERKHLYEGMFILSTTLSDEARAHAFDKVIEAIKRSSGEILKIHEWGRRRLAYEVEGRRDGYYYIVYFEQDPAALTDMWSDFQLHEDLIRFLTLRTDKVLETLEFEPLEQVR